MLLSEILCRNDVPNVSIAGIKADSREVEPGDLFLAMRGQTFDGVEFIDSAVERGAVAICADRVVSESKSVPCVVNCGLANHAGELAARFYGHPALDLSCTGITGTNGKSSIAYMAASIIDDAACLGTIGWGIPPQLQESKLTTLDPVSMQRCLAELRKTSIKNVFLEASSHALDQGRLDDLPIDCAVFSNLSRDHRDYHGSMAAYARAKRRLFERDELKRAIVNVDDALGLEFANLARERGVSCLTYGSQSQADVRWIDVQYVDTGLTGMWITPWGRFQFELPLFGDGYLANAAAILALSHSVGLDLETSVERMSRLDAVPGRMHLKRNDGQPTVVIDYAHSPDALANALCTLRRHNTHGSVVCVFGCGGDRDRGKRAEMGRLSEELADLTVLTNDNPRTESPDQIAADILEGMQDSNSVIVELDRTEAIRKALRIADSDDWILVAGKGAETYQEFATERVAFSDLTVVDRLLSEGV